MHIEFRHLVAAAAFALSIAGAASAQNSAQIRFCKNGSESWTARDAAYSNQPGFFHQEIGLGDEGDYSVSVRPNGRFSFDAYAYERPDAIDDLPNDWRFVRQSKGASSFSVSTHSDHRWGKFLLIQLVKNGAACPGCTVTMTLTSKNCRASGGDDTGSYGSGPGPATAARCEDLPPPPSYMREPVCRCSGDNALYGLSSYTTCHWEDAG